MKTPITGFPSPIAGAGFPFATASATRFLKLDGVLCKTNVGSYEPETVEGTWRADVDTPGVINDLEIYIAANTRTTATTFTLMKNGVSTAYTATVGAGVTGWVGASGGPAAVIETDLLSVRMVTGTGAGSITVDMISSSFTADDGSTFAHHVTAGDYFFGQQPNNAEGLSQGITAIAEGNSFGSTWGGAISTDRWAARIGLNATATSIRMDVPVNARTVPVTLELYKNNVATGLLLTVPASTTGRFRGTASVALVAGDRVEVRAKSVGVGSGALRFGRISLGVRYASSGYDVFSVPISNATLQGYNAENHRLSTPGGRLSTVAGSPQFNRRKSYEGTLSNSWVLASIGGTGASWTVSHIQKNGANVVSLPVDASAVGTFLILDLATEVLLADGDLTQYRFQTTAFAQSPRMSGFTVESAAIPSVEVPVPAGALIVTGGVPAITTTEVAAPTSGALILTGGTPDVSLVLTVSPEPGALIVAGAVPSISSGITVAPASGSIIVGGSVPFISSDKTAVATQGAVLALGDEGPPDARLSQAPVLALASIIPDVRASQAALLVLAEGVPCVSRWCQVWLFTRLDGETYSFTSHDEPITFKGRVCKPCGSLNPSASESATEIGAIGNMELSGIVDDASIREFDLFAGKFDGCLVEVWEVPWSNDGTSPRRIAAGRTGSISHGREGFRTEVLGVGSRIQQQAVTQVVTAACRFVFGDARCGKDLTPLRVTGVVTSAPVQAAARIFTVASLAGDHPDGYFVRGVVTFTSGLNEGLRAEVKEYAGATGTFVLWTALPSPIVAGDAMTATPGCELSRDACIGWANLINFGGFPDVPGDDATSETPDAKY